jgi:hypothetical protein
VLCPSSGTFGAEPGRAGIADDRSGGLTEVSVPNLTDLIPAQGAAIAGGSFTAYADLANTFGTAARILAQTKSVHLTMRPHGATNTDTTLFASYAVS